MLPRPRLAGGRGAPPADGPAGGSRRTVWDNRPGMDPGRKRAIRLTIALTVALLLASALVYTSFTAGRDELTASQLLKRAQPGQSYILAGTVLDGSVRHEGSALLFRVRDPKLDGLGAGPLHRRGARPVRAGPRGPGRRPRGRLDRRSSASRTR